ncbi:MAG: hypothetical protein V3T70_09870, partial [Phycisphaerae bacterium]
HQPVEDAAESGPVRLAVRAAADTIILGDRLELHVVVTAKNGVDIEFAPPDEQLGEFVVRNVRDAPPVPENDSRRWVRTYSLDVFASGPQEIPELGIAFVDRRGAGADAAEDDGVIRGELSAGPLSIDVISLLAAGEGTQDFRDIKGPLDWAGRGRWAWLWWAAPMAAALAAAAAMFLIRRRRAALARRIVEPPHLWALNRLKRLEDERLIGQGRVQEYYFRLSGVVRQYIERRFHLMAPERTTDEFLVEAQRATVLGEEHKRLLAEFLQACDLVKFARYEPSARESDAAMATARGFVEQTALRQAQEPAAK